MIFRHFGNAEIMVGYSDSAKDAGRLAATWAQFETQVKLSEVAKKHAVDVVYFHGKGGTVGRGGNPNTFKAILSHAPGTINGQVLSYHIAMTCSKGSHTSCTLQAVQGHRTRRND